jgi:hypothetical protein
MTGKTFMNAVANGKIDILQIILDILARCRSPYCVIEGLAVNAYVEPVVSLDLDLVVAAKDIEKVRRAAEEKALKVEEFEHSVNVNSPQSDLRVQIQTDDRYQEFISRAEKKQILGYEMYVAGLEDVLRGKIWAYADEQRRKSKRQKDLADILRLVEAHPRLIKMLPPHIRKAVE